MGLHHTQQNWVPTWLFRNQVTPEKLVMTLLLRHREVSRMVHRDSVHLQKSGWYIFLFKHFFLCFLSQQLEQQELEWIVKYVLNSSSECKHFKENPRSDWLAGFSQVVEFSFTKHESRVQQFHDGSVFTVISATKSAVCNRHSCFSFPVCPGSNRVCLHVLVPLQCVAVWCVLVCFRNISENVSVHNFLSVLRFF